MNDRHAWRIKMHVVAIVAAFAMSWIFSDVGAGLAAGIVAFLAINAVGHIAFGPMPTAQDIRRDIEVILRRPDQPDRPQ